MAEDFVRGVMLNYPLRNLVTDLLAPSLLSVVPMCAVSLVLPVNTTEHPLFALTCVMIPRPGPLPMQQSRVGTLETQLLTCFVARLSTVGVSFLQW